MAVDLVKQNGSYAVTGEGLFHAELQCNSRMDVDELSTNYLVGSVLTCTEDWSLWELDRGEEGKKYWKEIIL